ncbi:MAG: hypothetical protein ACLTKI_00040 [Lachnospiraceae bacterium]
MGASSLAGPLSFEFSHRMNIRCFLPLLRQEEKPSPKDGARVANAVKSRLKLACKPGFARLITSDEYPMLLAAFAARRKAVQKDGTRVANAVKSCPQF